MNIPTPIPVQFCNHKGIKTHPLVTEHNINLYPASTLRGHLPMGLCVSHNSYAITFRFCWKPTQQSWRNCYFEIITNKNDGHNFYSGAALNFNMHRDFMHTYEMVLPIAQNIFTTGPFAKLAA